MSTLKWSVVWQKNDGSNGSNGPPGPNFPDHQGQMVRLVRRPDVMRRTGLPAFLPPSPSRPGNWLRWLVGSRPIRRKPASPGSSINNKSAILICRFFPCGPCAPSLKCQCIDALKNRHLYPKSKEKKSFNNLKKRKKVSSSSLKQCMQ